MHRAQVAAFYLVGFLAAEAFEDVQGADFAGPDGPVVLDEGKGLGGVQDAAPDTADSDAPGVVGVVQAGDLHLDGAFFELRGRNEFEDIV